MRDATASQEEPKDKEPEGSYEHLHHININAAGGACIASVVARITRLAQSIQAMTE